MLNLWLAALSLAAPFSPTVQGHDHGHARARPPAAVVAPPAEPAEVEIGLGVRRGQLRYDREMLLVRPGVRVRLLLANMDDMLHNWVLCAAGADVGAIGAAALQLGAEAMARQFVPPAKEVLCHTPLVEPGRSASVDFIAPAAVGDYPFVCTLPGHAATMRGVLRVCTSGTPIARLRYRCYDGAFARLPEFAELTPVRAGDLADGVLDVAVAARDRDFALAFEGTLEVGTAGTQRFHLDSDDGSRVWIDGKVVVERDGVHAAGAEASGEVQLERGDHALRVEFFQREGERVLRLAWSSDTQPRLWLTRDGPGDTTARQELIVADEAIVQRAFVEDGPERAIAVGLVGGVSFCFDAERCCVAAVWRGGFLDVGPDRHARGGRPCRIVGQRLPLGDAGFPLRFGGALAAPRFLGYRVAPEGPTFSYAVGARRVHQRLTATATGGLRSAFAIEGPPAPVTFTIARGECVVASSSGRWEGDTLHLSAGEATEFTITIEGGR